MTHIVETQHSPSNLSDRTLTMNLFVRAPDHILIRSCEVVGRSVRSRFSFSETRRIEDVLAGRLAHAIAHNLKSIPQGAHILSLPEFLLDLPGLVLMGAHVMVMEMAQGARSIILRFKEFLGAANNAFIIDVGFHEPAMSPGEKLAMSILEDICLPILNMCHTLEASAVEQGHKVSPKIRETAHEFRFQTELLKRFIANTGKSDLGQSLSPPLDHYLTDTGD